jgi:hypothetical protein
VPVEVEPVVVKESVIRIGGLPEGTASVVVRCAVVGGLNHTTKKLPGAPLPFVPVTVTHATGVSPCVKALTELEQDTELEICKVAEVMLIESVNVV